MHVQLLNSIFTLLDWAHFLLKRSESTFNMHSANRIANETPMPISRNRSAGLTSAIPTIKNPRVPPSQSGFFGNQRRFARFIRPFSRWKRSLKYISFRIDSIQHSIAFASFLPSFEKFFIRTVAFNWYCCDRQPKQMYLTQTAFFAFGVSICDRLIGRCTFYLKCKQSGANFFNTSKWIVNPSGFSHWSDFLIVYPIENRYIFD